jgi:hypothetical protein
MSDHISFNMAHESYNVVKYLPYGPVRYLLPYLIRRVEENKSVTGQSGRELHFINLEIERRKNHQKAETMTIDNQKKAVALRIQKSLVIWYSSSLLA